MRGRMAVIRTLAAGALAIALGGAALGADSLASFSNSIQTAAATTAAEHANVKIELPDIAASVVAALTGGANPSTELSRRATNEHANANAKSGDADVAETANVEAGHNVTETGTAGTKPGFGCGDTNHQHSGPPGRPGATLPPGCTKH